MDISVIVPIYGVEKYIENFICLGIKMSILPTNACYQLTINCFVDKISPLKTYSEFSHFNYACTCYNNVDGYCYGDQKLRNHNTNFTSS